MACRFALTAILCGVLCTGCGSTSSQSVPSPTAVTTATPPPIPTTHTVTVWSSTTLPASGSVLTTVWKRNDALALAVLWRGTPGWWGTAAAASPGGYRESGTSGQDGVITSTLQFGALILTVTFDTVNQAASLQGKSLSLPRGTNVLLVDEVDSPSGAKLAQAVTLDQGDTRVDFFQSLWPLFSRSPEIMSFLQCDLPVTGPYLVRFGCDASLIPQGRIN
jgi:hypothetical protein